MSKDAFLHTFLAQLDTPERSFKYAPSSILAVSASNERPTSEELSAARRALEFASADRVQYADMVLRLQAGLDQARKELAQVDRYIEAHRSVLSPIRGLPAELLLEIFRYTFRPSHDGYGFVLTSYHYAPWVLSHVCRYWRDVVVGCPTLWSSFSILFASRQMGNLLALSLSRSQMRPLSFFLDLDLSSYNMAQYRASNDVYRTLVEHSNRWCDVVLNLDRSLASKLALAKNKLDTLHRVEIVIRNVKELSSITNLFANAPKLQHVILSPSTELIDIALPWSQLSSLRISSPSLSCSFIEAVGNAVVLERLTVWCHTLRDDNKAETACTARLPALRYMATDHPKLLASLDLPAVEELICSSTSTQLNYAKVIWDMICPGRSAFAALTSLTIFDNDTTPKYILLVLQTVLTLEELDIEVTQQLTQTYLDPLLLQLRSQSHLLPRLRVFSFEEFYDGDLHCQCGNFETGMRLLDVMHGRHGVLETVRLALNHHIAFTTEDKLRLQTLEQDGLDFNMFQLTPPDDESEEAESLANSTGSEDSAQW